MIDSSFSMTPKTYQKETSACWKVGLSLCQDSGHYSQEQSLRPERSPSLLSTHVVRFNTFQFMKKCYLQENVQAKLQRTAESPQDFATIC